MKYTQEVLVNGKKVWKFNPPKDAKDAGVVAYKVFTDGRVARHEVPKLIDLVASYRKGDIKEGALGSLSLLVHLRNYHQLTDTFKDLSGDTQKANTQLLDSVCMTYVGGKTLGEYSIGDVGAKVCQEAYNKWLKHGSPSSANSRASQLSILMDLAGSLEIVSSNPMAFVTKTPQEPQVPRVWEEDQVEQLLEIGYKDFKHRNITLLAHLSYEWCQRPKDISVLTWSQINWEQQSVTITQTTNGNTVVLPIDSSLMVLLMRQEEDFGFQQYVVPHTVPSGSVYKPMRADQLHGLFTEVRDLAGLDSGLHLGSLRTTGIMELLEAGVDPLLVTQVSGHSSTASLQPYVRNTLKGATAVLLQRRTT